MECLATLYLLGIEFRAIQAFRKPRKETLRLTGFHLFTVA